MASYGNTAPMAAPRPGQHVAYGAPVQQMQMPVQAPPAPAGTFAPGTKIQVGGHRVIIHKYLSEGGFAHVYLVKLPQPVDGTDQAVLKRVAVPDRETLRGMRTEVETMKRLKGHRPIVTYIDSHASERQGGGYEVFLLMEYCNGGGLIDFMNTRLQHRLTEPEILNIFSDIAEGVACMHYLKPPLLHRDLKVENVLITMVGSRRKFKLCDFGSAAPPKPAPETVVECRLIDEDIQRHTTMQYRSPEMVDVYRKQPIDEKSDIWALGVLLYKLCYYTTPFEDQGQLAILNASFRYPSYPVFSDRLKQLIASMLRENPKSRPNIYQVLRESCLMQGREVPIHDIYSSRSRSEPGRGDKSSIPEQKDRSSPAVGAVYSPPTQQQTQAIPEITPMRRGRLPAGSQPAQSKSQPQGQASRPKPSPSPLRVTDGDPFAALDSKSGAQMSVDELSSRFPTLDQFALLHDQGAKFDFDSPISPSGAEVQPNTKIADRLADEAFGTPQDRPAATPAAQKQSADLSRVKSVAGVIEPQKPSLPTGATNKPASAPPKPASEMSRASAIISSNPELRAISSPTPPRPQDTPSRPTMVSTGTMTSTPPPERSTRDYPPIHRFPPADDYRSSSLAKQQDAASTGQSRPEPAQPPRPSPAPRVSSIQSQSIHIRQPSSSRPSLEGGRPSLEFLEPLAKASSLSGRPRPASTYLESNLDYLREREAAPRPPRSPNFPSPKLSGTTPSPRIEPQEDLAIESNVDFLRSMEGPEGKKKDKGVKNHMKRSSLGSLAGTKNIIAGKFGDAFKRFENTTPTTGARTPSPLKSMGRHDLTPIAGSEATDGRSDDGNLLGEPEMTPEMRREIEAQSLAEEERRVEAAAAEYRQRMAARDAGGSAPLPKSIGGVSRAVSIQNRVQNLLDESQRSSQHVQRTASGYGKFSDEQGAQSRAEKQLPELPRKPVTIGRVPPVKPVTSSTDAFTRGRPSSQIQSPSPSSATRPAPPPKPKAGPKPPHLNNLPTGGSRAQSPPKQAQQQQRPPPGSGPGPSSDVLVGVGLPGRPMLDMSFQEKEDYVRDFSKRYPSLSSIEMVERDVDDGGQGRGGGGGR
ncbi:protein kinase-like domain-containing protein [Xylariomycetidae sp. FL2044]|nr:protein kinase-like domain-containing protein [Xylariomycetidae sp. FL2044]